MDNTGESSAYPCACGSSQCIQGQWCATNACVSAKATTEFKAGLSLVGATDFSGYNESKFVAGVSTTAGANAANVKVTKTEYTNKFSFTFSDASDVTEDGVGTAISNQCNVSKSIVVAAKQTGGRRLFGGRRLTAGTVAVTVKSTDPSKVLATKASAANPAAFRGELNTALGKTVPEPTATTPELGVELTTTVISNSLTPVDAPSPTQLGSVLTSSMNINITSALDAVVKNVPTMAPTAAPTAAHATAAPTAAPTSATAAPTGAAPTAAPTTASTSAPTAAGNTSAPTAAPAQGELGAAAPLSWSAVGLFCSMLTVISTTGAAV
jgi:hypothetical protein